MFSFNDNSEMHFKLIGDRGRNFLSHICKITSEKVHVWKISELFLSLAV